MRIELRELCAAHGAMPVLRGVSLTVEPGELVALLGPSGAGKSTLLAAVAGLHPSTGELRLDGRDAARLPPRARGLGMVFQELALWPHLSVAAHLDFVLGAEGVRGAEAEARVRAVLAQVELAGLEARRPAELSGGEARRLALARALVGRPRALLLDEPFGSLDRGLRERMLALVAALHARERTTTLLVSHDPDEALALAGRVAVLHAGRLLQVGPPAEVYRRPASALVAELTGPVSVVPARRAGARVALPLGELGAELEAELAPGCDTELVALLRPEDCEVRTGGPGRLRARTLRSGRWLAEVELGGCVVTALCPAALEV